MIDRQSRALWGQETMTVAGERLIYTIRRSRKAKHLLLHVDEEGQVEVVVPWRAAVAQATKFVHDQHEWLRHHLQKRAAAVPRRVFEDGSLLPFFDQVLTLSVVRDEQRQRATVVRREFSLRVQLPRRGSAKAALAAWYRREARACFTAAAQRAAHDLGVSVARVSIGNHKTQWGSCSARGRLSFNWRLLLGPRWIAEYVVAHEVAHLVHHNHSTAYWALVEKIYPEHRAARQWLREHASTLRW
jgi:predicted metal-dependent hydrolase